MVYEQFCAPKSATALSAKTFVEIKIAYVGYKTT